MRYTQEQADLIGKESLAAGIFSFTLRTEKIAQIAAPGQFVQVLCGDYTLRRPISIAGFSKEEGTLRLIFEVRGKGTDWLSGRNVGEKIDLLGPLGHGFPLKDPATPAVMVGGGIGSPPLLPLARHFGANATVICGFRSKDAVILQDDFAAFGAKTVPCTDDGSAGYHGFTTAALEKHLNDNPCGVVYTCGPKVMMKRVAELAKSRNIPCYVSMEERMGCGFGACVGCVCKTVDESGSEKLQRVCINGPVFDAAELNFD